MIHVVEYKFKLPSLASSLQLHDGDMLCTFAFGICSDKASYKPNLCWRKSFIRFLLMESNLHHGGSSKADRKVLEKNRRNHMKNLYSQLSSLVPNHNSKEVMSLPDQLNEAIEHVQRLEKDLEWMKSKKRKLMVVDNMSTATMNNGNMKGTSRRPPEIEIHCVGFALEVILISGMGSEALFYKIIRVLHEEGAEVVNASFSVIDDAIFHTIHSEVGEAMLGYGVERVSQRLKKLIHDYVV